MKKQSQTTHAGCLFNGTYHFITLSFYAQQRKLGQSSILCLDIDCNNFCSMPSECQEMQSFGKVLPGSVIASKHLAPVPFLLLRSLHGKYIAFNYRENIVKQSVNFSSPQEKHLLIGAFLYFWKENRTNKRRKIQMISSLNSSYFSLMN